MDKREQAIWWVNQAFDVTKEKLWNDGMADEAKDVETARNMAIEALQKQAPMNPVVNAVFDAEGKHMLNDGWVEDALLCPKCYAYFGEVYDQGYCSNCGQKLIQKTHKRGGNNE